MGLAPCRRRRVLPLVEAPTGEADLPFVGAQARGTPGQDQPGLAVLLEERSQDAGIDVTEGRHLGLVDDGGPPEERVAPEVVGHRAPLAQAVEGAEHAVEC